MTKKQEYLLIIGLLILIFPFFALILFVHPQGDDFFFAAKVNELGVLPFVKDMYLHWSGRYASMFIGAFDPLRFESIYIFRLSLLFFQLSFILSIFTIIKSISKQTTSVRKVIIFSLSFYIIFINGIPDVLEFLYWFPSVTAYQLGLSLHLIFIANYFFNRTNRLSNSKYFIYNSILAIIIIGLIELSVIPLAITSLLFIIASYYNHKRNIKIELIIGIMILIFSLITILAPGNYMRMSDLSLTNRLLGGAILAIKSSIFSIGYLFQNTSFILSSILFISLIKHLINEKVFAFEIPKFQIKYILLLSIIIIPLILFPATAALSYIPPGRVFNFIQFYIIIIWLIGIILFVNYYKEKYVFKIPYIYNIIISIFVVLFLFSGVFVVDKYKFSKGEKGAIFLNGNILNAYYVLINEASGFDNAMTNKKAFFVKTKSQNKKVVHIKPLDPHPKLLLLVDWNDKQYQNKWVTIWESKYYNIDSIFIEELDNVN